MTTIATIKYSWKNDSPYSRFTHHEFETKRTSIYLNMSGMGLIAKGYVADDFDYATMRELEDKYTAQWNNAASQLLEDMFFGLQDKLNELKQQLNEEFAEEIVRGVTPSKAKVLA